VLAEAEASSTPSNSGKSSSGPKPSNTLNTKNTVDTKNTVNAKNEIQNSGDISRINATDMSGTPPADGPPSSADCPPSSAVAPPSRYLDEARALLDNEIYPRYEQVLLQFDKGEQFKREFGSEVGIEE
jgi:hypothetical protein